MRDKHEIRTEVGVKQNCFVHCFEFASEVIITVPVCNRYFTCYTVAAAQCQWEKKGTLRWVLTAVFLVILITLHNLMHARMQLQASSYSKYKGSLRQAPGGQSRFSNQYFLRAFLSSELLLRIKECTVWTTKRTLSGYLLPLHEFHIWELFLCEFSTISNLINFCHSWPSPSVGWTDLL